MVHAFGTDNLTANLGNPGAKITEVRKFHEEPVTNEHYLLHNTGSLVTPPERAQEPPTDQTEF